MEKRVKICPNCGAANEAKDRFCANCGAPLASVPVTTAPSTVPASESPTPRPASTDATAPPQPPASIEHPVDSAAQPVLPGGGKPDAPASEPSAADDSSGPRDTDVADHQQPGQQYGQPQWGPGAYGEGQQPYGQYDQSGQYQGQQQAGQYGQPSGEYGQQDQSAQQGYDWQQQYPQGGEYGQPVQYGSQSPYGHDPNGPWAQPQPSNQPWYESGQPAQPGYQTAPPPTRGRSTLRTVTLLVIGVLLLLCIGTFVFAATPYGSQRIERLGTWAANEQTQQANGN